MDAAIRSSVALKSRMIYNLVPPILSWWSGNPIDRPEVTLMEWPLFVTKSIIGGALNPICISLLLCLTGAALWILRPRRRVGFILVMSGSLVLLVMSLPLTGDRLVRSLELKAGEYDPGELSQRCEVDCLQRRPSGGIIAGRSRNYSSLCG
jgi:hypothetical protein